MAGALFLLCCNPVHPSTLQWAKMRPTLPHYGDLPPCCVSLIVWEKKDRLFYFVRYYLDHSTVLYCMVIVKLRYCTLSLLNALHARTALLRKQGRYSILRGVVKINQIVVALDQIISGRFFGSFPPLLLHYLPHIVRSLFFFPLSLPSFVLFLLMVRRR